MVLAHLKRHANYVNVDVHVNKKVEPGSESRIAGKRLQAASTVTLCVPVMYISLLQALISLRAVRHANSIGERLLMAWFRRTSQACSRSLFQIFALRARGI